MNREDSTQQSAAKDIGLFERFLAGDDEAFVQMYDRHNHRLFLYCLKIVGNEEQAEDLIQEMWERVIRLRATQPTVTNPMGLFLTIARNLCLNHVKARRNHSSLEDLAESDHPAYSTREMSHLEELVVQSLPRLPFAQREVLILNAYSGYRFDEIASMLGESVTAVRMRASRARAHLGRLISAMLALNENSESDQDADEMEEEQ